MFCSIHHWWLLHAFQKYVLDRYYAENIHIWHGSNQQDVLQPGMLVFFSSHLCGPVLVVDRDWTQRFLSNCPIITKKTQLFLPKIELSSFHIFYKERNAFVAVIDRTDIRLSVTLFDVTKREINKLEESVWIEAVTSESICETHTYNWRFIMLRRSYLLNLLIWVRNFSPTWHTPA